MEKNDANQESPIASCRCRNGRTPFRRDWSGCSVDAESVLVGAFQALPHTRHSGPEYAAGHRTCSVGPDPHEVIAPSDGKTAYISIYSGGRYHALSVIDLVGQKALPDIDTEP